MYCLCSNVSGSIYRKLDNLYYQYMPSGFQSTHSNPPLQEGYVIKLTKARLCFIGTLTTVILATLSVLVAHDFTAYVISASLFLVFAFLTLKSYDLI